MNDAPIIRSDATIRTVPIIKSISIIFNKRSVQGYFPIIKNNLILPILYPFKKIW